MLAVHLFLHSTESVTSIFPVPIWFLAETTLTTSRSSYRHFPFDILFDDLCFIVYPSLENSLLTVIDSACEHNCLLQQSSVTLLRCKFPVFWRDLYRDKIALIRFRTEYWSKVCIFKWMACYAPIVCFHFVRRHKNNRVTAIISRFTRATTCGPMSRCSCGAIWWPA